MPGAGEESVWDYPRPPRIEAVRERVRVELGGATIADSTRAVRVLETASPPTFYIPTADVRMERLTLVPGSTFCEWKGTARYFDVRVGERISSRAAWTYPEPSPAFAALRDHISFYAGRVDRARVGDAVAEPQPGDFYGGWVTPGILGPFKGEPGTLGW